MSARARRPAALPVAPGRAPGDPTPLDARDLALVDALLEEALRSWQQERT